MADLPEILTRPNVSGPVRQRQATGDDLAAGADAVAGGLRSQAAATRTAGGAIGAQASAQRRAAALELETSTARARAMGNLGDGLTQLGVELEQLDQRLTATTKRTALSAAKAEDGVKLQRRVFELNNGRQLEDGTDEPPPAADERLRLFNEYRTELRKARKEQWKDDAASYESYSFDMADLELRHELDVRTGVVNARKEERAGLVERKESFYERALVEGTPQTLPIVQDMYKRSLDDMVLNRVITSEDRAKKLFAMDGKVSKAHLTREIRDRAPEELDTLSDTLRKATPPGISPVENQEWITRLEEASDRKRKERRDAIEAQKKSDKEAEEKRRDATLKDLADARRSGDPQYLDKIQKARGILKPGEYDMHLEAAKSPREIVRDNPTYLDLMGRAGSASTLTRGEKEKVLKDALTAASGSSPKITVDDYDRVRNELQSSDKKPTFATRGKSYITIKLTGKLSMEEAIQERLEPKLAAKLANALDDWDRWIEEHAGATDDEAEKTYKRITQNTKALETAVDVPSQYAVVKEDGKLDLRATGSSIGRKYWDGEIQLPEYNRQMARLRQAARDLRSAEGK